MAESAVQICNLALARIGVLKPISSLSAASAESQACNLFFEQTRDLALSLADWPWARKRATLAELDLVRSGWTYVYQLPNDCLVPREVYSAVDDESRARNLRPKSAIPFQLEQEAGAPVLVTDLQDAGLLYTARVTTPGTFPASFVDAFSWLLAADLVMPLSKKPELEAMCRQRWLLTASQALAVAGNAQQMDPPPESEWVAERG